MNPRAKKLGLAIGLLAVVPISLVVLSEAGEIVVIRSEVDDEASATRVWIVDAQEGPLVRGAAGKGWVDHAVRAGQVTLERGENVASYEVVSMPGDEARREVNAMMATKYGLADRVIGLIRDYDEAVPLLLVREGAAPE